MFFARNKVSRHRLRSEGKTSCALVAHIQGDMENTAITVPLWEAP